MRKNSFLMVLAALTTVVVLNIAVAAAAKDEVIKVGKKGEIMFNEATQVGDLTLKPGHYRIQHRVDGSDHVVSFTQLMGPHHSASGSMGPMNPNQVGEIKCRVEPMDKRASQTAVTVNTEGGTRRITEIKIAGENVVHLF